MRNELRGGYPVADFAAVWAKYRRWRWIKWGLFLGWVPFIVAFSDRMEHWHQEWAVFPVLAICLVTLIAASWITSRLRCPRCGSRFFEFGPFGLGQNPFARKCGNCELGKWQCQSVDEAVAELDELRS
jgi:hypothetical protein